MELEEVEQSKEAEGQGSAPVALLACPLPGVLCVCAAIGETGGQIVGEQGELHKF